MSREFSCVAFEIRNTGPHRSLSRDWKRGWCMSSTFTEKDFYLAEYHGRTLAMAVPAGEVKLSRETIALLGEVFAELAESRIRVLLLSDDAKVLAQIGTGGPVLDAAEAGWVGRLWRGLQDHACVGLASTAGESLPALATRTCLRLKLAKLVWLSDAGAMRGGSGERVSLIDLATLDDRLAHPATEDRATLLGEIRAMIVGGLPSVSICEPTRLADELYTYAGSGTFFSRERYVEVRNLALDEFGAAVHLIARGVDEGYLVERSAEQIEATLGNAFGAFVEGRYLAGICALIEHPEDRAGEISSLYTLTRFVGEGVGGHLVGYAAEHARELRNDFIFACTTSQRVEAFFHRNGFETVAPDAVPDSKWTNYAPDRRDRVICLRRDVN
jgi:N-acetylglutamate synthase-like GNAT family acetyltransferase